MARYADTFLTEAHGTHRSGISYTISARKERGSQTIVTQVTCSNPKIIELLNSHGIPATSYPVIEHGAP